MTWVASWIAVGLLLAAAPLAAKKKSRSAEDLFNPLLGIEYSYWLVGPIAAIASETEVDAYLALASDEEAARFVEAFWSRRNEGTAVFTKTPQKLFEERGVEADKRFTEGTYPGGRTDRGTIFILYGEPEKVEFESPTEVDRPTLELWRYPKDAPKGLDGERPKTSYRFFEDGDKTVFYTGQKLHDRRPRFPGR